MRTGCPLPARAEKMCELAGRWLGGGWVVHRQEGARAQRPWFGGWSRYAWAFGRRTRPKHRNGTISNNDTYNTGGGRVSQFERGWWWYAPSSRHLWALLSVGWGGFVCVVVCLWCCSCRVVVCVTCFSCNNRYNSGRGPGGGEEDGHDLEIEVAVGLTRYTYIHTYIHIHTYIYIYIYIYMYIYIYR